MKVRLDVNIDGMSALVDAIRENCISEQDRLALDQVLQRLKRLAIRLRRLDQSTPAKGSKQQQQQ